MRKRQNLLKKHLSFNFFNGRLNSTEQNTVKLKLKTSKKSFGSFNKSSTHRSLNKIDQKLEQNTKNSNESGLDSNNFYKRYEKIFFEKNNFNESDNLREKIKEKIQLPKNEITLEVSKQKKLISQIRKKSLINLKTLFHKNEMNEALLFENKIKTLAKEENNLNSALNQM